MVFTNRMGNFAFEKRFSDPAMKRRWNRWNTLIGVFIPYFIWFLIAIHLPLDQAALIGGDDGFELAKAMLVERHPELASRMWNDQPWLHTLIHAWLFRHFGEHAAFPRYFSLISLGVLLLATAWALREELGFWGGLVFPIFLLMGNETPTLTMAAMLELPTQCWAIAAGWLALRATSPWQWIVAGAVWAAAAHMKLTALMIAPALAVSLLVRSKWRGLWRRVLWIGLGFVPTFLFLIYLSPRFDLQELIATHWKSTEHIVKALPGYRFNWSWFLGQPEHVLATIVCIILLLKDRSLRKQLVYPLALLATALFLALWYRPWWSYYEVFLLIPMATLGGVAVAHCIRNLNLKGHRIQEEVLKKQGRENWLSHPRWSLGIGVAILALGAGFGIPQISHSIWEVRVWGSRPLEAIYPWWPIVKTYAQKARWIFTFKLSASFFLKVPVPPELIVVPKKRIWTGQFTPEIVATTFKQYHPEIVILPQNHWLYTDGVKKYLDSQYVMISKVGGDEIWVSRSICKMKPLPLEELVKKLGL